jgi:SEC-C motif-containing protein
MRSRYTAYARKEIPYLLTTLHSDHRKDYDEKNTRAWAESSVWHRLEIIRTDAGGPDDTEGKVEFKASFTQGGKKIDHHELAIFRKEEGNWYFVSGEAPTQKPIVRSAPKVGRNDPCPCGSGKKLKKCCDE